MTDHCDGCRQARLCHERELAAAVIEWLFTVPTATMARDGEPRPRSGRDLAREFADWFMARWPEERRTLP